MSFKQKGITFNLPVFVYCKIEKLHIQMLVAKQKTYLRKSKRKGTGILPHVEVNKVISLFIEHPSHTDNSYHFMLA